jgi:hypothetical protein
VTLRAKLMDPGSSGAGKTVYAHVMTALHEYEDEVLDACLFGVGDNSEAALVESSIILITGVAGPIKSFLDDKPVCMSCQAGFRSYTRRSPSRRSPSAELSLSNLECSFHPPSFVPAGMVMLKPTFP